MVLAFPLILLVIAFLGCLFSHIRNFSLAITKFISAFQVISFLILPSLTVRLLYNFQ